MYYIKKIPRPYWSGIHMIDFSIQSLSITVT